MKNKIPHPRFLSLVLFIAATLLMTTTVHAQDGDQEAKLISAPKVDLPKAAEDAGVDGKVVVVVSVDDTGKVSSVERVIGPDWVCPDVKTPAVLSLRAAAKASALQAVFQPSMRKGKAAKSEMILNFEFGNTKPNPVLPPDVGVRKMNDPDKGSQSPLVTPDPLGRPLMISGGVLNGKARSLPKPGYPRAARAVRASGAVAIHVLIDTDGHVYSAEPVSGHPLLRADTRMAACSASFGPTLLRGQPVKVSGIITYNFVP
jgi:protein TonB